ncbi:hemicentin-1-like [Patiria miniata]|uniref:receptor protein-tyrosine kinase n=1 Tax=Patiria miniata TaxID=46514 RepID=A0A914A8N0_PATMI|nr:hemicentin-1-like [Patiria miniata]
MRRFFLLLVAVIGCNAQEYTGLAGSGPHMVKEPHDIIFNEDSVMDFLYLDCEADGDKSPTYTWRRNDEELDTDAEPRYQLSRGRLTITQPDKTVDMGTYQCFPSNQIGTIMSKKAKLDFAFLNYFPEVGPPDMTIPLNTGMCISCDIPHHFPGVDVFWYYGRLPILQTARTHTTKDGRLCFANFQKSDNGEYRCYVVLKTIRTYGGSSGAKFSDTFQVTAGPATGEAQFGPELAIAVEDQEVLVNTAKTTLSCFFFGNPTPRIQWRRKTPQGAELPALYNLRSDNQVLVLMNIQVDDAGEYECYTEEGDGRSSGNVIVNVPPTWVQEISDTEANIYKDVIWECEAASPDGVTYKWYRNVEEIMDLPRHQLSNGQKTLTIKKLTVEDTGMYQCVASNDHGEIYTTGQLTVLVMQPWFSTGLKQNQVAPRGGTATIICQPEAAPTPTIRWFKESRLITSDGHYTIQDNGNLLITDVVDSDAGEYTCEATNIVGSTTSTGSIVVREYTGLAGSGPHMVKEPHDIIFNEDSVMDFLYLDCEADGDESPTYTWRRNDEELDTDAEPRYRLSQGRLTITQPDKTVDMGTYQCFPSNQIGTIMSKKAKLDFAFLNNFPEVGPPDMTIPLNTGMCISCDVPHHFPGVDVFWYYGLFPILQTAHTHTTKDGRLCFANFQKSDNGEYRCYVVLKIIQTYGGSSGAKFSDTFQVTAGPATREAQFGPELAIAVEDQEVLVNTAKTTLSCFFFGNPTPRIQWRRKTPQGAELPALYNLRNDNQVLVLMNIQVDDAGEYECYTEEGDGRSSGNVVVNVPPTWVQEISDMEANMYEDVIWECEAASPDGVTYKWYRNVEEIMDLPRYQLSNGQKTLTIKKLTVEDTGMYQCVASNDHGEIYTTGQLTVLDAVNYCDVTPGCSHHCLPSPSSPSNFTCACPHMAHLDTDGRTCLCKNGKPLLSDGTRCQEDPQLPVKVRGLTSGYLADHGSQFNMRCIVSEEEGVICTPRGAKEATVADAEGRYECHAPHNVGRSPEVECEDRIGSQGPHKYEDRIALPAARKYEKNIKPQEPHNYEYKISQQVAHQYEDRISPEDVDEHEYDDTIPPQEETPMISSNDDDEEHLPPWAEGWKVPRCDLIVGERVLGSGNFGEVRSGGVMKDGELTRAAIKMLKGHSLMSERDDFIDELRTTTSIGHHPNVVLLLGACQHRQVLYVALEYLPRGDLRSYLRTARSQSDSDEDALSSYQLVKFALDVANGMEHLAKAGVIHRDLAARNILLSEGLIAKVSDFGLSRGEDIYVQTSRRRVPVRWLAIESIRYKSYTTKSDVWSFGILLWEIVTIGGTPYSTIKSESLAKKLKGGYRMPKPSSCNDKSYALMRKCWEEDPNNRPSFSDLVSVLSDMDDKFVESDEANSFLANRGISKRGLHEECCHEGCSNREVRKHC